MNGQGCMIWEDQRKYNGDFKNDLPHGEGIMYWPNGKRYQGEFMNGHQNGIGHYSQNGEIWQKGIWKNGVRETWLANDDRSSLDDGYPEVEQATQMLRTENSLERRSRNLKIQK